MKKSIIVKLKEDLTLRDINYKLVDKKAGDEVEIDSNEHGEVPAWIKEKAELSKPQDSKQPAKNDPVKSDPIKDIPTKTDDKDIPTKTDDKDSKPETTKIDKPGSVVR